MSEKVFAERKKESKWSSKAIEHLLCVDALCVFMFIPCSHWTKVSAIIPVLQIMKLNSEKVKVIHRTLTQTHLAS